jgi:2-isopropylmalate synthase
MVRVLVLDSTLREGEQTPGVYFDVHIKLAIAKLLSEVGVDIIETGHPAVTKSIKDAVTKIAKEVKGVLIGAHARSTKQDVDLAIECNANFLGIFYCVSNSRLKHHNVDLQDAISKNTKTIEYAKNLNPNLTVRYTPEDAVRSSFGNVLLVASEAVKAGADIISIADTTGFMIPGTKNNMFSYISKLKKELAKQNLFPKIAVHCHNDRGLALANALDGFRAGATVIDASVLGLGERAGIVDLASLLTVLAYDFKVENNWNLTKLPKLYSLVSNFSKTPIPVNLPVTGKNAFTHCAGVHTHAALKNPLHYESLPASFVGRQTEIALDHMSGLSTVYYALNKIGITKIEKPIALKILQTVKETGMKGRTVSLDELKHIISYLKLTVAN